MTHSIGTVGTTSKRTMWLSPLVHASIAHTPSISSLSFGYLSVNFLCEDLDVLVQGQLGSCDIVLVIKECPGDLVTSDGDVLVRKE